MSREEFNPFAREKIMTVSGKKASATLAIRTFGEVVVAIGANGPSITFEARTVQALLLYLACHGRPLGREQLAELLWPERSQEQGRANLRVAIHRLRQPLDPYLLITRQTVALNRSASVTLDVADFEARVATGDLAAATALYHGPFLAGFYLDESPAYEQWALLERERLHIVALTAYQQLITQQSTAGQLDAAIASAQRLLQLDPYHEPTHRQLMRLLAQSGQRNAALAQYETCRRLLATELDVPPDETTTALAEQIRTGELDKMTRWPDDKMDSSAQPAVVSSGGSPLGAVILSSSHHLPPQSTPFIGRVAELAQIEQLLANPDCRLLTLLGVGGVGKTRTAIVAAAQQVTRFPDGICFVGLAAVGGADLLLVALAQRLGLDTVSSDLQAQVSTYLQPRRMLLVLDNFEHLLDGAETVAYLLYCAPQIKVLVTSRQRLHLLEEWLLPIGGLSLTGGVTSDAGALFLRSAQRVQGDFRVDGQEAAIDTICRQAEGMPLAIELAASWVRAISCAEIAQQMRHNLDFLTTPLRNLPERHRSIYALFDQSWRLLAPEEQRVLCGVSVFQGGWTLADAAQVLAFDAESGRTKSRTTLHHLHLALIDKSLLQHGEDQRFYIHELVRQYAAERLVASGEEPLIRQRHYTTFLQLARTADQMVRGPEVVTWFTRLEAEQDNLRAAWQWALDTGRFAEAAWLGVALCHTWHIRARWYEVAKMLEQVLPHRQTLAPDLRLAVLLTLYRFWRALHTFAPIEAYAAELNQLEQTSLEPLLRAAAWFYLANATPDPHEAGRGFDLCLTLLDQAATLPGPGTEFCFFADRTSLLAMTYFRYALRLIDETGAYDHAEKLANKSLRLFEGMGNHDMIAYPLGALGHLALLRGDLARAHRLLQEAVLVASAVGNRMSLGDWQPKLGIVTFYLGDAPTARQILHDSLRLWLDLKNNVFLARIYGYLAEIALTEGAREEAAHAVAQSMVYQARLRWLSTEVVDCLWVAARLAAAQQQYEQAATRFGLAEQVRRKVHYHGNAVMRPAVDAALAAVQAALESATFAEAFAAGQGMSLEEAFVAKLASNTSTLS
ncbi:MAG: BTAD domain-containing putative transcriptional regulator [Caldilineaceae bacterium]